jgi:uncharacterized RDD family membrane protein YckC
MKAHAELTQAATRATFGPTVEESRATPATFRDRFAAQILDLWALSILGWTAAVLVSQHYGGIGPSWGRLLRDPMAMWAAAAVAAAATLLYFFLFECFAGASLGKLACGLKVRSLANSRCGIVSALVRTVFRPVDTLLGPPFILLSGHAQRLGDRVAGTLVVKPSQPIQTIDSPGPPATWEERTKAAIVDLAVLSMFALAYCFATGALVDAGRFDIARPWLFIPLVQVLFLYFVALDGIFGGTLGKLVCNLQMAPLDGSTSRFTPAAIRALFYPANLVSLGLAAFLPMHLTQKRRHLGDLLAGAWVTSQAPPHRARVWVTAAALSAIAALAVYPLACRTAIRLLGSHQ